MSKNMDQLQGHPHYVTPQFQIPLGQNPQAYPPSAPPPNVPFQTGILQVPHNISPPPYSESGYPQNIPLQKPSDGSPQAEYCQGHPNPQGQFGYSVFQAGGGNIPASYPFANFGENGCRAFDFSEQSTRKYFIRKVYGILMCQLLVTTSIMAIFIFDKHTKDFVKENAIIFYIAIAITFVCFIVMSCCEYVSRRSPTNFIFLGIFTLALSLTLGTGSSLYDSNTGMQAIGLTAAVCFSVSMFAMQTKSDFTAVRGILLCSLVLLILFGIVTAIVGTCHIMRTLYTCGGVLIFSIYLIYDTQLMLSGKHNNEISPEEYIFAVLSIYFDIILMFIFLLLRSFVRWRPY